MKDQRQTIMVISPSLGIGGRERIAINTVKCFENLGYHAILVIFQNRDVEYPFDGELINLNIPASKRFIGKIIALFKRSYGLFRLRKKFQVPFVYSLGDAANVTNVFSGITHRGKTIISLRVYKEIKKNVVNTLLFSLADWIICVAKDMQHGLLQHYPRLKHTEVIENGRVFPPLTHFEEQKAISPHIVTMGRLEKQKGFDRLIRSFRIVHADIPDSILTIIGEGSLRAELTELADQLSLREAVRFQGYLSDPYPVLQAQNIYVMTSYEEGFPNALIEAMYCGLPIVSVDCHSGPREILSKNYSSEAIQDIKFEQYGVLVDEQADGFEERFAQAVQSMG